MAQFNRKQHSVEARQHFGAKLNITSFLKGEQTAHSGDFLVVDPVAVQTLRDRETVEGLEENALGNRGTIYVVPKDDFLKDFDAQDSTPTTEVSFNVPDALNVNDALAKSSGDGTDAGDWTTTGNGTEYPTT